MAYSDTCTHKWPTLVLVKGLFNHVTVTFLEVLQRNRYDLHASLLICSKVQTSGQITLLTNSNVCTLYIDRMDVTTRLGTADILRFKYGPSLVC